jgi:hypothetical protein
MDIMSYLNAVYARAHRLAEHVKAGGGRWG